MDKWDKLILWQFSALLSYATVELEAEIAEELVKMGLVCIKMVRLAI